MNNVSVVYTSFTNLKKTAGMDVGQVGFHSQKKVRCELLWEGANRIPLIAARFPLRTSFEPAGTD